MRGFRLPTPTSSSWGKCLTICVRCRTCAPDLPTLPQAPILCEPLTQSIDRTASTYLPRAWLTNTTTFREQRH